MRRNPFPKLIQQILPLNSFWVMSHASSKTEHVQEKLDFCDWPSEACGCRKKTLNQIDAFPEKKKEAEAG